MFSDLSEYVISSEWLIIISDLIITYCVWMNLELSIALIWGLKSAIFIGFENRSLGEKGSTYMLSWLEGFKNGESGNKFALFWGYLIILLYFLHFISMNLK